MSQLVRLRDKHTDQTAHCALYRLFKFAVAADQPDAQTPYVTPRNRYSPSSSPATLTFFFTLGVLVPSAFFIC